jgi:hypothetical protein
MGQQHSWKNFLNLILCEDFWVPAKWYFFVTSHGNSEWGKHAVTLQWSNHNSRTKCSIGHKPHTIRQLSDCYWTRIEEKYLYKRNSTAKAIQGILKLHAFVPIRKGTLIVNKLSSSEVWIVLATKLQENVTLDDAKYFAMSLTVFGG